MNKSKNDTKQLKLYGYTKEEDGRFVSICVNLSLFAQGKSPDESMKKLFKNINIYLKEVSDKYADDWDQYAERDTDPEIVEEFKLFLESTLELADRAVPYVRNIDYSQLESTLEHADKAVQNVRDRDYSRYTGVQSAFVKKISRSYAQANL